MGRIDERYLRDHALWATKVLRPERGGALRRDDARNLLRRTLQAHAVRYSLRILAWSAEPSRVHLVLQLPLPRPASGVLGDLFGYYTRRFNARYRQGGALFRSKFLRRVVLGPLAVTDAIRRVHRAPFDADVVPRPGQEPWSSESCYDGAPHDGVVTLYVPGELEERRPGLLLDA